MTQCVQRRSSETSSIIDKSKEATLSDRESSVAQTMDQKHSEIEIVEFKPNSDSANENVDSNLTPAAVE
uniref:Uncharacterized protein n=1 Tax=Anopheles albimanus TaxID=7167 RepID=A0A182F711_ANOAL